MFPIMSPEQFMMPQDTSGVQLLAGLARDPESLIPTLAAAGVAPPPVQQAANPMDSPWAPHNMLRKVIDSVRGGATQSPAGGTPPSTSVPQTAAPVPYLDAQFPWLPPTPAPAPARRPQPVPSEQSANVPLPRPRPTDAPQGTPTQTPEVGNLAKALAGVKAPPAPEAQRISSPSVPRPAAMGNSQLVQAMSKAIAGGMDPVTFLRLQQTLGGR